jgi:hypothetical protein
MRLYRKSLQWSQSRLLFPGPNGAPLGRAALNNALRRLKAVGESSSIEIRAVLLLDWPTFQAPHLERWRQARFKRRNLASKLLDDRLPDKSAWFFQGDVRSWLSARCDTLQFSKSRR